MVKRKLSDEEKKITEKSLVRKTEERDHLKLMVEYNDFMVDKMLYSNYLEKLRVFKTQTKELKSDIAMLDETIKVCEEQIRDGVEIKEKVVDEAPTGVN